MAGDNKARNKHFIEEIWTKGNYGLVPEFIAPGFVAHDPSAPFPIRGPEGYVQWVAAYRNAFPDVVFSVEDQVAEGDKIALRWTAQGTHVGPLMGIPPTGRTIQISGAVILRFAGGRAVESWGNWDALGMLQQIGAIPALG